MNALEEILKLTENGFKVSLDIASDFPYPAKVLAIRLEKDGLIIRRFVDISSVSLARMSRDELIVLTLHNAVVVYNRECEKRRENDEAEDASDETDLSKVWQSCTNH